MKIQINIVPPNEEEKMILNVHKVNEKLSKVIDQLSPTPKTLSYLLAKKEETFYKIDLKDIFYIETVDRKQYLYTKSNVYEVSEKLYVLEEKLDSFDLIRVSKSMILNIEKIHSFYPKLSGNLEARLLNQEKVGISRRYVSEVKKKLGMMEDGQ